MVRGEGRVREKDEGRKGRNKVSDEEPETGKAAGGDGIPGKV